MGDVTDDLKDITVTVTSPDGRIEGHMRGLRSVSFRFRFNDYENYYRHGDVAVLEHQLARGATLLATTYIKNRQEVMRRHGFTPFSSSRQPTTRRHREYLEKGAELKATGGSAGGEIRARTRAMRDFKVKIDPVVFRRCDQAEFLQLANAAMVGLRKDYDQALKSLRHTLYLKYRDQPNW
ncbi:hypothetical protein LX16_3438 [Stackebrandtia albiflava]|uniref:Uncharacterized protein n=1 Tax=Stackebrandtia albiflava TaxID=406432 RepID=A0A562V471_9ACTN|nr:hypothetical protein [Stackebrandtia albiflava]TWJ12676.1 hypothetical protein LX16_3438 [Stackebrandtia albiflava]